MGLETVPAHVLGRNASGYAMACAAFAVAPAIALQNLSTKGGLTREAPVLTSQAKTAHPHKHQLNGHDCGKGFKRNLRKKWGMQVCTRIEEMHPRSKNTADLWRKTARRSVVREQRIAKLAQCLLATAMSFGYGIVRWHADPVRDL